MNGTPWYFRFSLSALLAATLLFLLPAAQSEPQENETGRSVLQPLGPPAENLTAIEETAEEGYGEATAYQIPMVLNDSVENHLEYFKTKGRESFQKWLDRSSRYIPVMRRIFREKDLPEDLVYVAMIESGFNPYAVSWARAVGPWQFMPQTGKLYGLRIDWWVDERKDPIKSTYAAAEHLRDLRNLFGSWPLALASYNAGAGKVQRALLHTQSEDFWDLKASRHIRRETKNYIPKYMAATIIARNPEAYGFSLNTVEPFSYDEVIITESTDLRLIAECAGTTYEKVKELNPELKRWVTPPYATRYVLRLPPGSEEQFLSAYASVPSERKVRWERHRVRKGDSLARIARKYGTTPEMIRDVNGLHRSRVVPGKHLLVPLDTIGRTGDLSVTVPDDIGKRQQILYRVRRGDSLSRIARQHDVTVADIRSWNNGIRTFRAGQKIKLVVDVGSI